MKQQYWTVLLQSYAVVDCLFPSDLLPISFKFVAGRIVKGLLHPNHKRLVFLLVNLLVF